MRDLADEEEHLCSSGGLNPNEASGRSGNGPDTIKPIYFKGYLILIHLAIIVLLVIAMARASTNGTLMILKGVSWSPVQDSLRYELNGQHALKHHKSSLFAGRPTSQQESAWTEMLAPMYFAATRQEMLSAEEALNNGVQLASGNYLATIGVYHELHCLQQMRLFLYRERYYHNITESQEEYLYEHLDHCLEALRITIMCHGNTGLYTFAWESATPDKATTKSNARSACVKWNSIEEWSRSRPLASSDPVVIPSA
ncbi:hypothetical protein E0Z10_g5904 [Xylaria hypoxylon]|uniref:Uncharacterized protein n=1 Tax=Xylaria hypoxylon TaxID=37992 RepID=A0A4Z0YHF0_9PEZI|nr:hypothetical protein E0Z10_g5904 [Xylaria hypoxylon]